MHGEHAIEDLGRDEVVVRADQLDAYDGGFYPANNEKEQRKQDVENA
jgi:hypothetical protein